MDKQDEPPTLGFIGAGTIASAIITGLCSASTPAYSICISPRNAQVAADLASRFPCVRVAGSNQEVVDASKVVFLAIRPQVAVDVLEDLRFRSEHHIVTLIATFSHARVAALVAPAGKVTCAVPQPTVAARHGPTAIFPPDPLVASLFNRLGASFEASSEREFRALFASTAAMAAFFTLLDTLSGWLTSHNVPEARARDYVARMFQALARVPGESASSFSDLAADFKTKGGLNEQFANELAQQESFSAWSSALDGILARIVRSENQA